MVLVGLAIAALPLMELDGGKLQSPEQFPGWKLRALGPVLLVVDHLVTLVLANPTFVQSFPSAFLRGRPPPGVPSGLRTHIDLTGLNLAFIGQVAIRTSSDR